MLRMARLPSRGGRAEGWSAGRLRDRIKDHRRPRGNRTWRIRDKDARQGALGRSRVFQRPAYSRFWPASSAATSRLAARRRPARDVAVQMWGIPRWLANLAPDQWNSVAAISGIHFFAAGGAQ